MSDRHVISATGRVVEEAAIEKLAASVRSLRRPYSRSPVAEYTLTVWATKAKSGSRPHTAQIMHGSCHSRTSTTRPTASASTRTSSPRCEGVYRASRELKEEWL
jgi:hypothetical protein